MKENKLRVIIEKPVEEVFEFTTNPKNTSLWIPQIKQEISDSYPPKINTLYKNIGSSGKWNSYVVIEFKKNMLFTLKGENNYFVRYTYSKLGKGKTELEYFEWVEDGSLENPFTPEILQNLKRVLEN